IARSVARITSHRGRTIIPTRFGMHYSAARVGGAGMLTLTLALSVAAQGRGGPPGPDTRPEVTFKVDLPADDARLAAMKKEAIRKIDSMAVFTQQMVDMVF